MSYAVIVFFDPETDAFVRRLWKGLEQVGVPNRYEIIKGRPHISLGVWDDLNEAEAIRRLPDFARRARPFAVSLAAAALLPDGDVYLIPDVTPELLHLYTETHRVFAGLGQQPRGNCRHDCWLPHATIGYHVEPSRQLPALDIIRKAALPLQAQVTEVGLIRFHPLVFVACRELGPDATRA